MRNLLRIIVLVAAVITLAATGCPKAHTDEPANTSKSEHPKGEHPQGEQPKN